MVPRLGKKKKKKFTKYSERQRLIAASGRLERPTRAADPSASGLHTRCGAGSPAAASSEASQTPAGDRIPTSRLFPRSQHAAGAVSADLLNSRPKDNSLFIFYCT